MIVPGLKAGARVAEALRLIAQRCRQAGVDTPELDARVLIGHACVSAAPSCIAQAGRVLEAREIDAMSALTARRLTREPVARIVGVKEFWSLPLTVTPDAGAAAGNRNRGRGCA